jgi:integrative and conjugative element protein (TIGR02256 family)
MVEEALHGAELLVDASASVAVARFLARDVGAGGRRVSLFLNPGGSDLVLLAEDAARTIPLDLLEMQYYRLLAHDAGLVDHFAIAGGTVRYGAGCRDRSAVIPQDLVALHAATASRALRDAATTDEARVAIFRAGRDRPGVEVVGLEPITAEEIRRGEWTLYADHRLLQEIADARNTKLPNETGGVLIGAFDTARRIVYVVDQIPSPPDSQEWPTLYIRGAEGLRERVEEIERRTLGNLVYVGEWHSHPDGHGCSPSDDDASVFAWLAALRRADGLPPVMLIAGQTAQYGWFVGALHGEPTEGGR